MVASLRIIPTSQSKSKQNCAECPHIDKCWKPTQNKTNNIIINLLVCRIQNDIYRDKSTRLLLAMVRPQLQRMSRQIRDAALSEHTLNYDNLINEMESVIVEHILDHYIIGEIAFFTYYLFGFPNGVMRKWLLWKINNNTKFFSRHYLVDEPIQEDSYNPHEEEDPTSKRIQSAFDCIDDGITLRASEYRVMKFCLKNARDNRPTRMVDGLHLYMAEKMSISRTRVTQHFRNAKRKLVEACM